LFRNITEKRIWEYIENHSKQPYFNVLFGHKGFGSHRDGGFNDLPEFKRSGSMHKVGTKWGNDPASALKILIGKWFFLIYSLVYAGFIVINVLSPAFMGIDVGSLNVAIVYGFGLIIFAMLLAMAYNHISTLAEELFNGKDVPS
jgi:hypothetical protein